MNSKNRKEGIYSVKISMILLILAIFSLVRIVFLAQEIYKLNQLKKSGIVIKAAIENRFFKKQTGIKYGLFNESTQECITYNYSINSRTYRHEEILDSEYYSLPYETDSIEISYLPDAPRIHIQRNINQYKVITIWDVAALILLGLMVVAFFAYEAKRRGEIKNNNKRKAKKKKTK
ncbi:MAG: hypothetical protein JXR51_06190 [Bacteroidales bacterium]|nr:hypothetical protein [Bacteroidales bacterium]MBN2756750.1 hypothetical protein [Bacteroidales bacterium]